MQPESALQEKLAAYRRGIPNAEDLPVYKLLQRLIQAAIAEGEWKPGEAIPPERLFAKLTGASVGTVKKAIGNLVNDGILYRRQGSGTFVASGSFVRNMRKYYLFLSGFDDTERANSIILQSAAIVRPIPEVNQALQLAENCQLIQLTRQFREDADIIVLTRSYFSAESFAPLLQVSPQRFEKVPLYVIIEEDYRLRPSHSDELLTLRVPGPEDAKLLGSGQDTPVLFTRSLTYATMAGTPFEYRESYCRPGNKYMYRRINYS